MQSFDFSADKPVEAPADDYFQRYEFARRIAQVIGGRRESTSITLGVYGAWGEGKTSVMNFIARELTVHTETIVVPFNPWRFADESSLLLAFFGTLANRLKLLSPDHRWRFQTRKEGVGELITKYAKYAAVLKITPAASVADAVGDLGKALSDVPLETLKARIEQLLLDSRRKIVVIIDDIDRLEKSEIHAVFRLVKLTADFPYTHYILCFDDQIVAASLGERFGEGNPRAGHDFLEKIIQIPLRIPQATKTDLRDYLFALLEQALRSSPVEVPVEQLADFQKRFNDYFLPQFTTPRLAKRYVNSISFVLPLLQNEVNYHDLLLMEAIKLFYPGTYHLIRDNHRYFLGSFEAATRSSPDEKARHTAFFDPHLQTYPADTRATLKELLAELFPKLKELWSNYSVHNGHEQIFNDKRIGSPFYFNRYFSYAITKGETSDMFYDTFFAALDRDEGGGEAERLWRQALDQGHFGDLYMRLYFRRNDFSCRQARTLINVIASYEGALLDQQGYTSNLFHRFFDATHLVAHLLTFRVEAAQQLAVLDAVYAANVTFGFVFEVALELLRPGRMGDPVSQELKAHTEKSLLGRALTESRNTPMFALYATRTPFLFKLWVKHKGPGPLAAHLQQHVADERGLVQLIQAFASLMSSSAQPEPYFTNFGPNHYRHMSTLFPPAPLVRYLPAAARAEASAAEFPSAGNAQPAEDDLLLAQFGYWCAHPPLPEQQE